jgi:hypothetical protein
MLRAYLRAARIVSGSSVVLTVFALGCEGEERACYPGDFVACACDDGLDGYAQCDAEGAAYGACGYCGTTPGLADVASSTSFSGDTTGSGGAGGAAAGGSGGAGGAELLPFTSPCESDEQCETGLCYSFAAKGPHCSQACDGPEDCPPPSPGCNGMGICKVP